MSGIYFELLTTLPPTISNQLLAYCQSLKLEEEIFNGVKTPRQLKWFGHKSTFTLRSMVQHVFHVPIKDKIDGVLGEYRDRFYPEANSILIYHYSKNSGIGEHTDKGFDPKVVVINLLDSPINLFGDKDDITWFLWGGNEYQLFDGQVVQFDSSISHAVKKLKCDRYSIQFRKIPDSYDLFPNP